MMVLSQDHEIHRQWVALVDDENPKDSGTQGYLQLSVAIVGPGDKLKVCEGGCGGGSGFRLRKAGNIRGGGGG